MKLDAEKICSACDSPVTYIDPNGHEQWRIHDGFRLCKNCYTKYVSDPIYAPIRGAKWNHIRNKMRIYPKGKVVFLKENPRKGICSICGKKAGELFINSKNRLSVVMTDMHHIEYHDDDPLKDTMELCDSCHCRESARLRN